MSLQLTHPRHDVPTAGLSATPAPARPRFYLVGEAERAAPRPAVGAGRTSIAINGRWHALRGRTATFEQLLRIAFPDQPLLNPAAATVTFRHGVATWPAGLLTPGDVIPLTEGLVVNANATNAS